MAKDKKGGRTTPKGTRPGQKPPPSSRYTPPIPKEVKVSPPWVPVLMFTLLGLGTLLIIVNYVGLPPGSPHNFYLLGGLGLILAGIITATQYR